MQKTMLHYLHLELKAKMAPFAGFEMPIQYQGVKEEVLAVRKSVGIFDVSHMGEFFVQGKDCYKYLDYLLTNDIQSPDVGKAIYSPLCRQDGTVIDDVIVYKLSVDCAMVCVNAANIDKDWQWLEKNKSDFAIDLLNESSNYSLIALQGPKSEEIVEKLDLKTAQKLSYYSCTRHKNLIIARTGYTGEDGFEIFGPHQEILNLWQQSIAQKAVPCGLAARDVLRLEVGYPLYGNELSDDVTPLDSGLKWTLKKTDVDFIGKQSLLENPGKNRLLKLSIDKGIPRLGYLIINSNKETVGKVTSGTFSPIIEKGIALAHIERSKFSDTENYFLVIRGKEIPIQVHKKPFVSGGHK